MAQGPQYIVKFITKQPNDGNSATQHIPYRQITLLDGAITIMGNAPTVHSPAPSTNTLVIDNPYVAPSHLRISTCSESNIKIMAMQQRFRTMIDEEHIIDTSKWHVVHSGQTIRLGTPPAKFPGGKPCAVAVFEVRVEPAGLDPGIQG